MLQVALSQIYEQLRLKQEGRCQSNSLESSWKPPLRFTRDTTKFWLKQEDMLRFKCETVRHLPIFIFDRQEKLQPGK